MMGTIRCTYETPCGWCTKWDKKCDMKIGCDTDNKSQRELTESLMMNDDDCGLEWTKYEQYSTEQ